MTVDGALETLDACQQVGFTDGLASCVVSRSHLPPQVFNDVGLCPEDVVDLAAHAKEEEVAAVWGHDRAHLVVLGVDGIAHVDGLGPGSFGVPKADEEV